MTKKRSYWKNDVYIDITTGRLYEPKAYCELCGCTTQLTVHHYLPQQKCLRDINSKLSFPNMWNASFVRSHQKLFTLCWQCHADVEHMSSDRFYAKYNRPRSDFIYEVQE